MQQARKKQKANPIFQVSEHTACTVQRTVHGMRVTSLHGEAYTVRKGARRPPRHATAIPTPLLSTLASRKRSVPLSLLGSRCHSYAASKISNEPQADLAVHVQVGVETHSSPPGSHEPDSRGTMRVVVRTVHHEVEETCSDRFLHCVAGQTAAVHTRG